MNTNDFLNSDNARFLEHCVADQCKFTKASFNPKFKHTW